MFLNDRHGNRFDFDRSNSNINATICSVDLCFILTEFVAVSVAVAEFDPMPCSPQERLAVVQLVQPEIKVNIDDITGKITCNEIPDVRFSNYYIFIDTSARC